LSEEGIKQYFKTENQYMQDNKRDMHKIDEALYFVIEEKNNQVELTDNGIKYLSGDTDSDFCPSRHWN
jgi:preprotein translocase subunit SecA